MLVPDTMKVGDANCAVVGGRLFISVPVHLRVWLLQD